MIGTLRFKLPEEHEEFEIAQKGGDYKFALWDIGQQVFRPARKHGYAEDDIRELIQKIGEEDATKLIGLLEQKFFEILDSRGIEL